MSPELRAARLAGEVARFEEEVRRLALEIVRAVLTDELARRRALEAAAPPARAPTPAPAPAPVEPATPEAAPSVSGKRRVWSRESVIDELATWLLSGTAVDAAFVSRHGQPGLVAGAKRIFGRFDAALNAANVHLSQRYPDGPPSSKRSHPRA